MEDMSDRLWQTNEWLKKKVNTAKKKFNEDQARSMLLTEMDDDTETMTPKLIKTTGDKYKKRDPTAAIAQVSNQLP